MYQFYLSLLGILSLSILGRCEIPERAFSLDLYFYDPSNATCSDDKPPDNAIALRLFTPTYDGAYACFELQDLVDMTNTTFNNNNDDDAVFQIDGLHFRLNGTENYSSNANYSGLWYSQKQLHVANSKTSGAAPTYVTLYEGEQCLQKDFPYVGFSCYDEGSCNKAPFSVKSMELGYWDKKDDGKCQADKYNADPRSAGSSLTVGLVGLMSVATVMYNFI